MSFIILSIYFAQGAVVIMKDMVLVIAEGGPNAQRKFKRLMLHRIKWEEDSAQGRKQDKLDKKNHKEDLNKKMNSCQLIWEVGSLYFYFVCDYMNEANVVYVSTLLPKGRHRKV